MDHYDHPMVSGALTIGPLTEVPEVNAGMSLRHWCLRLRSVTGYNH